MRKTRLLAFLFNLHSITAVAGYECVIKLSQHNDIYATLVTKTLVVDENQLKSGNLGTLYVESKRANREISLEINAVLNGWKGEEDATFTIMRQTKRENGNTSIERLSDLISLRGSDKASHWFDDYKMDIKCDVK